MFLKIAKGAVHMSLNTLKKTVQQENKESIVTITDTPTKGGYIEILTIQYPSILDGTNQETNIIEAANAYVQRVTHSSGKLQGSNLLEGPKKKVSFRYMVEDVPKVRRSNTRIWIAIWFLATACVLAYLYHYTLNYVAMLHEEIDDMRKSLNGAN